MQPSTLKSIAVGAGAGLLVVLVGVVSYLIARPETQTTTTDSTSTTTVQATTTSTTIATADPDPVPPTTSSTLPPRQDFADLFDTYASAVGSIDTVTCNTARRGTAFLIADDLAVTSAAVVADHVELAVTFEETSLQGVVLGVDELSDVALVRLSEPVSPTALLTMSNDPARVGAQVGALTQPIGLPQTMIVGRVSSIDPAAAGSRQILTDADVAAGSGGGPLIDDRGRVVGVVGGIDLNLGADGALTAVSLPSVAADIDAWAQASNPVDPSFCVGSVDLDDIDTIAGDLIAADIDHPELAAIQRTYAVYSQSINSSRATEAFGVLGPAITTNDTAERWAEGQQTSKLWDWRVRSIEQNGDGLVVRSVFTSTQEAEYGFDQASTCTRWDVTHDLVRGLFRDLDYWLINRSRATTGRGPVDCDDWQPEVIRAGEYTLGDSGGQVSNGQLAGGTAAAWSIGIGLVDANDPDAVVEQSPITLEVTVDTAEAFDAIIEIFDADGALVASSDEDDAIAMAGAQHTVTTNTVLDVRVRDRENRNGGPYTIDFRAIPAG